MSLIPYRLLSVVIFSGLILHSVPMHAERGQVEVHQETSSTATRETLFRDVTLISGSPMIPRPHMDILVDGEKIVSVFAEADYERRAPHGATVIDLGGKFMLPGLIDSHVHVATPPNRAQAEAVLRRDLYGGITSVRDMADDLRQVADISRAALVGEIAAPDVYYATLFAGPRFFDDPRTKAIALGAVPGKVPWEQAVDATTDLPEAVAMARGTSSVAIKLYADIDGKLATSISREAHRQHMLVWAHATLFPASPLQVVRAGTDVVSHVCLLAYAGAATIPTDVKARYSMLPADPFAGPGLDHLLKEMRRRNTILDATLLVGKIGYEDSLSQSNERCTPSLMRGIMRRASEAGIPISVGTDAIARWSDEWPELYDELDLLVSLGGMSPRTALEAATVVGAKTLGREGQIGTVEAGKLANMIVLAKDPTVDLRNLKSIELTVKRGTMFRRGAFHLSKPTEIIDSDY